jgi:hypothetical protein
MFVKNPISLDPRVKREAMHLKNAGYEVTVIGMPDSGLPRKEIWEGIEFLRVSPLCFKTTKWLGRISTKNNKQKAIAPMGTNQTDKTSYQQPKDHKNSINIIRLLYLWVEGFLTLSVWVTSGLMTRADIYHAHDLNALFCAYLCSRIARKKLVYDSHELWIELCQSRGSSQERVRWWKFIEARAARAADLVVTVSDGIADELQQMYGIEKPLIVRNCAHLKPPVKTQKLRDVIGGDDSRPIILYQGGFIPGRGLKEIVLAAKDVPQADFVLMGHEFSYKDDKS